MVRLGKWDEQKVLFKNRNLGGHDHFGGTRGAHIAPGGLATGAVRATAIATSAVNSKALAIGAAKANKNLGTGCVQVLNPRATLRGTNVAKRLLWYGMVTKTRLAATQYTVTMGGATGFVALDWARLHARATRPGYRMDTSTVLFYNFTGRSTMLYLFLPASLGAGATASVFCEVWGRSA